MSDTNKLNEILEFLKAQDLRIDYNFNTIIQSSILIEFIFTQLCRLHPDENLETLFNDFQKERLSELESIVKQAQDENLEQEMETFVKEEILDKITL